jgi:hypothetical protein
MFSNARGDVVAHTHPHIRSWQKVDLVLKIRCTGFTQLPGVCLFLGS